MNRTRFYISGTMAALLMVGAGQLALEKTAAAQGAQAPKFDVDRLWPKPLGNHWIPGSINGVTVDSTDHIWVSHRGLDSLQGNEKGPTQTPWASECCFSAPQVMEFDAAGTLLNHWGGPGAGYDWPQNPSGITVDAKGNVWLAAAGVPVAAGRGRGAPPAAAAPGGAAAGAGAAAGGGRGAGRGGAGAAAGGAAPAAAGAPPAARGAAPAARGGAPAAPPAAEDAQVLKFSKTGQFVMQIGKAGQVGTPDGTTMLNRPAAVTVDDAANEVYVADTGDQRIAVFDANTGAFKRAWGGSGEKPAAASGTYDPNAAPAKGFRNPTCVKIAKDGKVYVCDKGNDRLQVFDKQGKMTAEAQVMKSATGEGSVSDIAFSADAQQRFIYVADVQDKTVVVLDRATLKPVGTVGEGGRYPGMFYGLDRVGVDSKGNLYTGETYEGKRVQKFIYKGLGPAQPMGMN